VRSWQRRLRWAALAPTLSLRVGRGGTELHATTDLDGSSILRVNQGDTWRFEASATWSLDKLVFDRDELRLGRESQRLAARREKLASEVAELYFERKRLRLRLAALAPGDPARAETG